MEYKLNRTLKKNVCFSSGFKFNKLSSLDFSSEKQTKNNYYCSYQL